MVNDFGHTLPIAYESGNIALHGRLQLELPDSISVGGEVLVRKSELHICLVCVRKIVEALGNPSREGDILAFCKAFLTKHPLGDYKVLPDYRWVKRAARTSVIVMCEVPGLHKLFAALERHFGVTVPVQPTHITLYTAGQDRGIEIASSKELEEYSQPVNMIELKGIL